VRDQRAVASLLLKPALPAETLVFMDDWFLTNVRLFYANKQINDS